MTTTPTALDGALAAILLDHAGEMLLAVDPQTLTIAAANHAACALLGYAPEELRGRLITDLESALSDVFYWEEVRQGARGEIRNADGLYRCSDDSLLPVVKDIRCTTANGRDWLILRVRDERRRLRGEENLARMSSQLKAALEATSDGILVIDAEGRIVNMNHRCGEMWEIPESTLHEGDMAITAWLADRLLDPDAYRRGMADATSNERGESFDVLALADGRFFERRARPQILDEQVIGRVYSFHDITERVCNERDLIDLRDRAEQASLAKGRFLAVMSHEIRTPMNGILGMAQLLLLPNLTETERLDYAHTVIDSGQTLLALLNDILDLSKIESGKIELAHAPFAPWQLIDEQAALFAGAARSKRLEITADWRGATGTRGHHYAGDALRLRQILANLIGNAVKFTASGFIRIEAGEIKYPDGRSGLEFSVTDSGIGIPVAKQALIFEPFTQADASTTREYGGTGLGLSIVKTLVALMDGEIGIASAPGQGARFWFRIPATRTSQTAAAAPAETEAAGAETAPSQHASALAAITGHILVVEDNATNRYVIEKLLARLGLSARCATNGEEGLAAIIADSPALVLMDCQMPVLDGFEATTAIRKWESEQARPRLPIIALTAGVFAEDRARCTAVGMDGFLAKPVSFEALTEMLTRWLTPATSPAPPTVAAPTESTVPALIFDKNALLDMLGDDHDLARFTVGAALHDMPDYFNRLEEAVAANNRQEAGRIIHSLKSLTAQIGGGVIVSSVKALDQHLKDGGQIRLAAAKALHAEYAMLEAELHAWMREE